MDEDKNVREQQTPPINVDDEVEVIIESRGERGDGVCKVNNFIVFVPGSKVGEKCTIQIEKVFKKFGIARRMITSENDILDTSLEINDE